MVHHGSWWSPIVFCCLDELITMQSGPKQSKHYYNVVHNLPKWLKLFEVVQKWSKVVHSGPNWSTVVQSGSQWSKVVQNGLKCFKTVESGRKVSKVVKNCLKWCDTPKSKVLKVLYTLTIIQSTPTPRRKITMGAVGLM